MRLQSFQRGGLANMRVVSSSTVCVHGNARSEECNSAILSDGCKKDYAFSGILKLKPHRAADQDMEGALQGSRVLNCGKRLRALSRSNCKATDWFFKYAIPLSSS